MTGGITEYIHQHEATVAPLYKDYSLKFWELSLSGNADNEKALVAAKEKYLKVYNNREDFQKLRSWKASGVQMDTIDARELKLIHDSFVPNQIEESVLRDIVERETQIETSSTRFARISKAPKHPITSYVTFFEMRRTFRGVGPHGRPRNRSASKLRRSCLN